MLLLCFEDGLQLLRWTDGRSTFGGFHGDDVVVNIQRLEIETRQLIGGRDAVAALVGGRGRSAENLRPALPVEGPRDGAGEGPRPAADGLREVVDALVVIVVLPLLGGRCGRPVPGGVSADI